MYTHIFEAFITKLSSKKVILVYIFMMNLCECLFPRTLTNTKYFNAEKIVTLMDKI